MLAPLCPSKPKPIGALARRTPRDEVVGRLATFAGAGARPLDFGVEGVVVLEGAEDIVEAQAIDHEFGVDQT